MNHARSRMHIKYCRDTRCTVETDQPGDDCKNMDFLLDKVENEALHREAEGLRAHADSLPNNSRIDRARRAGVMRSASTIDRDIGHRDDETIIEHFEKCVPGGRESLEKARRELHEEQQA